MWTEYSTNNSGGEWWLQDEDWYALEKAGWIVNWVKDDPSHQQWSSVRRENRFLGALAMRAYYRGSERMAIASFQDVTGQDPHVPGCGCCGQPHSFYTVAELPEHLRTIDGEVVPEQKEITGG